MPRTRLPQGVMLCPLWVQAAVPARFVPTDGQTPPAGDLGPCWQRGEQRSGAEGAGLGTAITPK